MNIAVIGSGGREHAICDKLNESKKIVKIYCIPGNAGTSKIAKNIKINFLNFKLLYRTILERKIDLVVVGPEEPLVNGIVDFLRKKKVKVFGPNKYASQLEGSKTFMKNFCKKNNIPTANYKTCSNIKDVKIFIKNNNLPIVVKADGLAAGKGVSICNTEKKILKTSNEIFNGKFLSSKKLVLEEFLEGTELSYFIIADEKNFSFIGSAQDHKRVGINDTGVNTGGMGAYSPAPILNKILEEKIIKKIIKPTLRALKKKKKAYTGFLYAGLMIKNNEPFLIEYNIRMGDPECQVIMPRIKTDLLEILIKSLENKLDKIKIEWKDRKCMTIVLCVKGYPRSYKKNFEIKNIDKIKLEKDTQIFHAATKVENYKLVSNGGRVLNINATGRDFKIIRNKILKIIRLINWKHGFFRPDIGWKVI
jgi:phosphoribosylamine--glycine ligase